MTLGDALSFCFDELAGRVATRVIDVLDELERQRTPEVLDDDGVMRLLMISRPTLRAWLDAGLPHRRIGSVRRYVHVDVIEWLRAR